MAKGDAVERVVQEHGRWVLGAARRRVGDAELAEDVAQGVFLMYWRKGAGVEAVEGAEGVEGQGKVAGWLYRAVRYCAANAIRLKKIRERHEREAAMERKQSERTAGWMEVEGELEGAMDGLSEKDRQAVVLRFYRGLSLKDVGVAMGLEEEAARKRVERAVGKLRERLAGKGVEVEAGSLGAMVLAHAVEGMEGGAAGLVEKVMAGIGGGVGNGTAGLIAKGAEKMMVLRKVKILGIGVVILVAIAGVVIAQVGSSGNPVVSSGAPDVRPLLLGATQAVRWTEWSSYKVETEQTDSRIPSQPGFKVSATQYRIPDGRSHIVVDMQSGLHREDILLKDANYLWMTLAIGGGRMQIAHKPELLDWYRRAHQGYYYKAGFLDGFVCDQTADPRDLGLSVLELAASSASHAVVDTTELLGVTCQRVTMNTASGRLQLWISPTHGNNVVKYELDRPADANKGVCQLHIVCEATGFAKVGDITVISEGRLDEQFTERDGNRASRHVVAKRSEIKLKPELNDPRLFNTTGIPDGLRVIDEDAPEAAEKVWRNGRPMPKDE